MTANTSKAKSSRCKGLNVILDIDETFLCFVRKEDLSDLRWSYSKSKDNEQTGYEMKVGKHGAFVLRPHARKFFSWLFDNCNVALWTWSDIDYANDVANLVTDGHAERFAFIYADTQAEESGEEHGNSKDLNYVWYKNDVDCFAECNTILVDDLPSNSVNPSNKENSITIAPFLPTTKDMHNDKALMEVLSILKKLNKHVHNCYDDDNKRYDNILSMKNVARLGLTGYIKNVIRKNKTTIKAIGVGNSERFLETMSNTTSSSPK